MKKYQQSIEFYHKAQKIYKKNLLKNDLLFTQLYTGLGLSYFNIHNYTQGYINFKQGYDLWSQLKLQDYLNMDTYTKLSSTQETHNAIKHLLNISYRSYHNSQTDDFKQIAQTTFNAWLNYKGSAGEGSNLLSMMEATATQQTKKDIKDLKNLTLQLVNLYNDTTPQQHDNIQHIQEKISTIEIRLNKKSEAFREFKKLKNISYQDISALLKPNQLYIDFAKMQKHYYFFSIDNQNHITFKQISQSDTTNLMASISVFLETNNKMSKEGNDQPTPVIDTKQHLYRIYNLLSQYINFNTHKELLISPDGLFNFLPFEALYDGKKYLVEKVNISYIPSGRELLRLHQKDVQQYNDEMVVFAYPDYGLYSDKDTNTTKSFTLSHYLRPLKGSKIEMQNIQKLYPKAKIFHTKNASLVNLFKIKHPKILHLSTHGLFMDNNSSTINPMQQVILAFANANYARQRDDYSGIATALQLSTLNLEGTQLVYLSACETGVGKLYGAEGVQGLPKAFVQAGAKNVIMSLWQVDDQATTTLTTYFYQNLKNKMSYKEALREAKLKMVEMHPYFWSGFILNGI